MSLADVQRALADALLAERTPDEEAAGSIAAGSERLTPAMQLEIYREQYWLRHRDVLHEDFRSLSHLLGDGFDALAKAYLQAFPPRSFSLRDLGEQLPRFVSEVSPWSDDALVAELARVEWAFVEAFDAPSAPALELASLAAIEEDAWPSCRVVLQPSLRRLSLLHAAHDYRLAVRRGEAPAKPVPAQARVYVVVFRGPVSLQCLELEPSAHALLDELARGAPLGDACERVASRSGIAESAFEANVAAWFHEWTALGWLSRVERGT